MFFTPALTEPTDKCSPGYYCPSGSTHSRDTICPVGKHCPLGSAEPQDCVAGTHVDFEGAAACEECPEGMCHISCSYSSSVGIPVFII